MSRGTSENWQSMITVREMELHDVPAAFFVRTATQENAITMDDLKQNHELTPETLALAMQGKVKGWVCEAMTHNKAFKFVHFAHRTGPRPAT